MNRKRRKHGKRISGLRIDEMCVTSLDVENNYKPISCLYSDQDVILDDDRWEMSYHKDGIPTL